MLAWFVFSTMRYFYYGRFFEELRYISRAFSGSFDLITLYTIIQVPVAAIGIFIMIPLLLKGHISGLVLGLVHWGLGYPTNPLWFIVPRDIQISPGGGTSPVLMGINIVYGVVTLVILVLFYLHRKALAEPRKGT